jgi:hypothetical protein
MNIDFSLEKFKEDLAQLYGQINQLIDDHNWIVKLRTCYSDTYPVTLGETHLLTNRRLGGRIAKWYFSHTYMSLRRLLEPKPRDESINLRLILRALKTQYKEVVCQLVKSRQLSSELSAFPLEFKLKYISDPFMDCAKRSPIEASILGQIDLKSMPDSYQQFVNRFLNPSPKVRNVVIDTQSEESTIEGISRVFRYVIAWDIETLRTLNPLLEAITKRIAHADPEKPDSETEVVTTMPLEIEKLLILYLKQIVTTCGAVAGVDFAWKEFSV